MNGWICTNPLDPVGDDFSFLNDALSQWESEKQAELRNRLSEQQASTLNRLTELAKAMGFEDSQPIQDFFIKLKKHRNNKDKLALFSDALASELNRFGGYKYWEVIVRQHPSQRALEWTMAQLIALKRTLKGLKPISLCNDNLYPRDLKPHLQCVYCGCFFSPEAKKKSNVNKDYSYCHTSLCDFDISEKYHPDDCHWKAFYNLKSKLKRQSKRARNKKDFTDYFITFCEERYNYNLQHIQIDVRTKAIFDRHAHQD